MIISKGTKKSKKDGKVSTSIIDIDFDNKYTIYVFQGRISKNDIIIKYAENKKRMRTPKHIHWAVDLLLKLQVKKELTREFINVIQQEWKNCRPLENNDYDTLTTLINHSVKETNIAKYQELNNYGEYDVAFLIVLMTLLMTQEKTNREDAYMFGDVLQELLKDKLDIFAIMSVAGFGGRF